MENEHISQLQEETVALATDRVVINRDGVTHTLPISAIIALVPAGSGGGAQAMGLTAAQLADGPLQLLRLNETSGGQASDATTNGHNGGYNAPIYSAASIVADEATSIGLDGSSSFIQTYFQVPAGGFSIEIVAVPSSSAQLNNRLAATDHTDENFDGFQLHCSQTQVSVDIGNVTLTGSGDYSAGVLILVTYDGTTAKLYANNVLLQSAVAVYVVGGATPAIGFNPAYGLDYWPGEVQNWAVYNYPLDSGQRTTHYNQRTVVPA